MKKIFKFFWAVWSGIAFYIIMLIVWPGFFILLKLNKRKSNIKPALTLAAWWAKLLLYCMLVRIKVHPHAKLRQDKAYIIVSNHRSYADIPVSAVAMMPTGFRFLSKVEVGKVPVLGFIMKRLYILLDRSNLNARAQSLQLIQKSLEDGHSVLVFPEGTRNRTDQLLKSFNNGAFNLAVNHKFPLVVFTMAYTEKINHPNEGFAASPALVHAHIDLIEAEKFTTHTELKDHCIEIMKKRLSLHY